MRWHIIGSTSYIAKRVIPCLTKTDVVFCYSHSRLDEGFQLDLTNYTEEQLQNIKKDDIVIIFAAISSPDVCQYNYKEAELLNVVGTISFVSDCIKKNANVIFLSSDAVLGPTEKPVDEEGPIQPIGNYAKMKAKVEKTFLSNPRFKVLRLSYVFSAQDKFMQYLSLCDQKGIKANVYNALYRNVVYINDVVDAIISLGKKFNNCKNQIIHVCGSECLSRCNLADIYKKEVSPKYDYSISTPDSSFFTARPNRIESKSLYLEKLLGRKPIKISIAMKNEFLRSC